MSIGNVLFSYSGRIDIATFWLKGVIPLVGAWVVLGIVPVAVPELVLLLFPVWLVSLWMQFAILAKRWHDRDKSGWMSLVGFIPFLIGPIWILIECGMLGGTNGPNRYGPKPGDPAFDSSVGTSAF
ncbi:MAG: DUF805 domain-containing protein [Chloroflexi bacterium]|nr:DUF805 domain-containing protein [Chloroflexota bacterium]